MKNLKSDANEFYIQNRNRLTDKENKFIFAKGERVSEISSMGYKRYKLLYTK